MPRSPNDWQIWQEWRRHLLGEKNGEFLTEQDKEVIRILGRTAKAKRADLEVWETAIRAAVLAAGAEALARLLEGIGSGRRHEPVYCQCDTRIESEGLADKTLLTILGPVAYSRSMFQCSVCRSTRYPGDEGLDVVDTGRSPGLRRIPARAGSKSSLKEGHDDLKVCAGIKVSAKDLERLSELIGEQMEAWSKRERREILDRNAAIAKKIPSYM